MTEKNIKSDPRKVTKINKEENKIQYKERFDSYDDYLKSDKWKYVKKEFNDKHLISGDKDICEVTGRYSEELHHHHFRYPKDWNDDSPENIVKIDKDIHDIIHDDGLHVDPSNFDKTDRFKYLSYLRREYLNLKEKTIKVYDNDYGDLSKKLKEVESESNNCECFSLSCELNKSRELNYKWSIRCERLFYVRNLLVDKCIELEEEQKNKKGV